MCCRCCSSLKGHGTNGSSWCSGDSGLDHGCRSYRQTDRQKKSAHTQGYVKTTDRQIVRQADEKKLRDKENWNIMYL